MTSCHHEMNHANKNAIFCLYVLDTCFNALKSMPNNFSMHAKSSIDEQMSRAFLFRYSYNMV